MQKDSNPTTEPHGEGEGTGGALGGHMKTALLNRPSFPIPHAKKNPPQNWREGEVSAQLEFLSS